MKRKIKQYWSISKDAFDGFMDDNAMRMGASLSYYTLFSLAPMLLIIISLGGIFFGREAVQGQIYGQIDGLIGSDAAKQVQDILKNAQRSGQSTWAAVVGVVTLLIGATGTFAEMQDAINFIWGLKPKPKVGIVKYLLTRFLSFSLIISLGFLLLVSLVVNAVLNAFSQKVELLFSDATVYIFWFINLFVVWAVIASLFTVIFKVLPDGKIKWKDAFVGAGFTSLLFMIGKYVIGLYLGNSSVSTTYGTAGSIVIILSWVYYSALILYFGAEFTKAYTNFYGRSIQPNGYTDFRSEDIKRGIDHSGIPKGELEYRK
jgi:membrane protein